jgi:hypothetical protein
MLYTIAFRVCLIIGLAGDALAQPDSERITEQSQSDGSSSDKQSDAKKQKAKEASPYSASLTHFAGFRGDVDPFTVGSLGYRRKLGRWTIGLSQAFTKYYVINDGESELKLADTNLSASTSLDGNFGFSHGLAISLTLPVSEFSSEQNVITALRGGFSSSRSFYGDKVNYALTPSFRYFFNQYTTTRSGQGDNGGSPLRHYMMSIEQSLSYKLLPRLNLGLIVTYQQIFYEDIGYRNRVSTASTDALLSEAYSIDLSAVYEVRDNLSVGGGYSQGDNFERTYGIQEFYLFDQYTTQVYLTAAYSWR